MIIKEINQNLFEVGEEYHLAHCISSDCVMGAGIAVEFQRRFDLRPELLKFNRVHPRVIKVGRVFNLITKAKCTDKPTYGTMLSCLYQLREGCDIANVKLLAMPRIGCGLDKLLWARVRGLIQDVFQDSMIEIVVCYL